MFLWFWDNICMEYSRLDFLCLAVEQPNGDHGVDGFCHYPSQSTFPSTLPPCDGEEQKKMGLAQHSSASHLSCVLHTPGGWCASLGGKNASMISAIKGLHWWSCWKLGTVPRIYHKALKLCVRKCWRRVILVSLWKRCLSVLTASHSSDQLQWWWFCCSQTSSEKGTGCCLGFPQPSLSATRLGLAVTPPTVPVCPNPNQCFAYSCMKMSVELWSEGSNWGNCSNMALSSAVKH